ncbi:MAG: preprotein translocase subunit SecG [Phycisphaerae bacterium]|nr:preprotein translocase subunit SecG [Phycisphaerae bacterium]
MMNVLLGASVPIWTILLAVVFFIVCIFLILIILLQKGRGGGLSAAFGGAGGQSAFGSKTGDVFTWVTVISVAVFFILAMVLSMNFTPTYDDDKAPTMQQGATSGDKPTAPAPAENNADNQNGKAKDVTPDDSDSTNAETKPIVDPTSPPSTTPAAPQGDQ